MRFPASWIPAVCAGDWSLGLLGGGRSTGVSCARDVSYPVFTGALFVFWGDGVVVPSNNCMSRGTREERFKVMCWPLRFSTMMSSPETRTKVPYVRVPPFVVQFRAVDSSFACAAGIQENRSRKHTGPIRNTKKINGHLMPAFSSSPHTDASQIPRKCVFCGFASTHARFTSNGCF